MAWVKLDDQRAMNLKLRRAGFAARGLDEAAICQVSADQTDGFISATTVSTLARAHRCRHWKTLVSVLESVGRWLPTDLAGEPGWYIHDYLEYNFSKAQWDELRQVKARAGRASGAARREHSVQPDVQHAVKQGVEHAVQPSRPVPLVKGGRGLKEPRVAARPQLDVGPAAPDVPIDPNAGARLRAVAQQELGERLGKK